MSLMYLERILDLFQHYLKLATNFFNSRKTLKSFDFRLEKKQSCAWRKLSLPSETAKCQINKTGIQISGGKACLKKNNERSSLMVQFNPI